jgi:RNA polymerase-interacting CarD/CdnL/TRCF family regulator
MDTVSRQSVSDAEIGPANWSRRYKENLERLRSGDRGQIIEVVRQLSEREQGMGISAGERRMLIRARLMLDDQGGTAGVREPRRPLPPDSAMSASIR